jgi:hypothetical protein
MIKALCYTILVGVAVGQDYSQWNDVYLTLQGRYGVRTHAAISKMKTAR